MASFTFGKLLFSKLTANNVKISHFAQNVRLFSTPATAAGKYIGIPNITLTNAFFLIFEYYHYFLIDIYIY